MKTETPKSEALAWIEARERQDAAFRERVEAELAAMRLEQDLVRLREARGLSQTQLGHLVGMSQPAIARIEAGHQKNLELRTLLRLVTGLGGRLEIRIHQTPAKVVGLHTERPGRWIKRAAKAR